MSPGGCGEAVACASDALPVPVPGSVPDALPAPVRVSDALPVPDAALLEAAADSSASMVISLARATVAWRICNQSNQPKVKRQTNQTPVA